MSLQTINQKVKTEMLIEYLEATIGDEMILNSFIRDLKIIDSDNVRVVIEVLSGQAKDLLEDDFKTLVTQGLEQIFEKPMEHHITLKGEYTETNKGKEKVKKISRSISSKFKMDSYVVSDFNKETVEIATKIVKSPGIFSPFYVTSKSGLGKTHLLHGIGNKYIEKGLSVVYIEPSSFTRKIQNFGQMGGTTISDYIDEISEFDVLIFDDIQNLGDRTVTLKVLFTILNNANEAEKQVIIASDKVAQELSGFEARFITRFQAGISSTIKIPEIDDLIKVLKFKLDKTGLSTAKWEAEAINFIARNNSNSIRSIEGAIKRVQFFTESDSNIKYTYTVISNIFKELAIDPSELTPTRIISVVSAYYKLKKIDITGKSRKQEFVIARHMTMWLIRKINGLSYVEIGKILGSRDHSTIMSGINKIEHMMKLNNAVKLAAERIESKIKSVS